MGGASAGVAAAMARARRRVISHFMSRNAVSPENAVAFAPDRRMEEKFFERLRANGVLVAGKNGTWYLDVPRFDLYQQSRRKRIGLVLAGIATALAAGVGIGLLG
ncbi:MAG: hypothetical protein JWN66_3007 [Sphingomonas bacterium]|uniref:hypothetical protein n=1 Tax=Sphingomonas bacterium TaxID=1895847 RepID=UPI002628A502|nr:hypothetical protein [Sphingomonas bacterium]MDB5705891.1 hypothetical protein [Sphingomonas bacterium]